MTYVNPLDHVAVPPPAVLEVALRDCYDASDYVDFETVLGRVLGVLSVHLDRTRGVAHLGYDSTQVSAELLRGRIQAAGYRCDCETCSPSEAQPGHPGLTILDLATAGGAHAPQGHAAMHAQKPAERSGHADHQMPAGEHAGMDHSAHAGHGEAMAGDMLRRFVISLLLTLPIILYWYSVDSRNGGKLGNGHPAAHS